MLKAPQTNYQRLVKSVQWGMPVRFRYNDKVRQGRVENEVTDRVLVNTQDGYRTFMLHKIQGKVDIVLG